MTEESNNIQAAIDAGMKLASRLFNVNDTEFMLVPEGFEIQKIPEQATPLHVTEHIKHETADSFIAYYERHASTDSVIFLNSQSNTFTAIFNYHTANVPNDPDWCTHKSSFALQKTPEWSAWLDNSGKRFSQEAFAEFITDNLEEITSPPGAEMLEIATSLQAKTKVNFSKSIKLSNGQTSLEYSEEINGSAGPKGEIKIPEEFSIGLRLYKGADPYAMNARLKYRIESGKLQMWYELIRPHKVIDANISDTKSFILENMKVGQLFEATR